jgi:predicted TIM-barrel fold metal-dependent hydrolase
MIEIDLANEKVVDLHCFSFAPTIKLTKGYLTKLFTLGGPTVQSFSSQSKLRDLNWTLAYKKLLSELATILETPSNQRSVLLARNERAKNFAEYARFLLTDARIQKMVIDNGIEPIPFTEFAKLIGIRAHRVFRVEPLTRKLLETAKTFQEFIEGFDRTIRSAVRKDNFVGFKSVIAYRTGLDVELVEESDAKRDFEDQLAGKMAKEWFGPYAKRLRDFLLRRILDHASRLGVFVQIHTGLGDTDIIATKSNPLFLMNVLKLEEAMKTRIILIHGGYPYTAEAAWLSKVFPNVYYELSTPIPPSYSPAISQARFQEALELVPVTRIVYGSDSIELPEFHWMAAKLTKSALGKSLTDLVNSKYLDEDEAYRAGEMILSRNASTLLKRARPAPS